MKTFLSAIAAIFALLVFFGCQGRTVFVISHNPQDKPLLVFPLITQKGKDWDAALEKGLVHFEGFKPRPYYCCAGVRTIGYGCTNKNVIRKGWISEKEARSLLLKEVNKVKGKVREEVQVKLSDNQLNALTSFAFNCGLTNLRKLVNGKDRLNSGNYKSVEKILPLYRRAGGKVRKGLERRRAWELALWKGDNCSQF
jgi:GH24 family phage-related lysozyme (muramidase)